MFGMNKDPKSFLKCIDLLFYVTIHKMMQLFSVVAIIPKCVHFTF